MKHVFDDFEVDTATQELLLHGQSVAVEPKVFDVLLYLIENNGRVVSRDELVEKIWDGRFISDAAVSTVLSSLRRALGDDGREQKYVKTIRGRGFRFIGELQDANPAWAATGIGTGVRQDIDGLPSIAVMPFGNMSRDPAQDYFADGICEDVTTALGRIRWLFVIARSSTIPYKGRDHDPAEIADELGVRYVLVGNVQKADDRVRISVQLLDARNSRQIWAERYDRKLEDVFAVQDEITENIVGALEPQVSVAENRKSQRKPQQDLNAWDCVIRAMALKSEFTEESSNQALELLHRALEIDPGYARAHSQIGWTVAWRIHQGWEDPEEALKLAIAAAENAVRYDANEPWAYIAWLFIATILRDADMLLDSPRKALEINPNFAMAHSWMGASLALTGNGDEAFQWIEKARRLSPRDIFKEEFDVHTSYAYFQVGDYRNASGSAHKAMLPHPQHVYPRLMLAASLGQMGATDAGEAQVHRIMELSPNSSLANARKSCVFIRDADIERFVDGLRKSGMT